MKAYYLLFFFVLVATCQANTLNRQPVARSNVPEDNWAVPGPYGYAGSWPRPSSDYPAPDPEERFGYLGGHLGGHIGGHLGGHVGGHVGGHLGARAAAAAAAGAYGGVYAG